MTLIPLLCYFRICNNSPHPPPITHLSVHQVASFSHIKHRAAIPLNTPTYTDDWWLTADTWTSHHTFIHSAPRLARDVTEILLQNVYQYYWLTQKCKFICMKCIFWWCKPVKHWISMQGALMKVTLWCQSHLRDIHTYLMPTSPDSVTKPQALTS